jgi:hypothetical protein
MIEKNPTKRRGESRQRGRKPNECKENSNRSEAFASIRPKRRRRRRKNGGSDKK